jgi:2-polyprenyl-3-methyl-5-hydroxy-6-metoxy-1,4-benzoquinol methylase
MHNPVKLVSYGSGPGHEILGCLESFRDKVAVEATCIDRDTTALEYGRSLAAKKGVSGRIEYVQGNVLRTDNDVPRYHAAVISGVLDYYSFETAVSMLQMVGRQLEPNGTVLIANMRRHYLASTMSILGNWSLIYREPEEVETILAKSGYEEIKVWLEPEKVFCIGKARKPR